MKFLKYFFTLIFYFCLIFIDYNYIYSMKEHLSEKDTKRAIKKINKGVLNEKLEQLVLQKNIFKKKLKELDKKIEDALSNMKEMENEINMFMKADLFDLLKATNNFNIEKLKAKIGVLSSNREVLIKVLKRIENKIKKIIHS